MSMSQEISVEIMNYLIGVGQPDAITAVYAGLMRSANSGNLAVSADFVTNFEVNTNYVGYVGVASRQNTVGSWDTPNGVTGAVTNDAQIQWPSKSGGTALQINGIFLIGGTGAVATAGSTAGKVLRWSSTFPTATLQPEQTPRIPVGGVTLTER